jgi:hypothetical protein
MDIKPIVFSVPVTPAVQPSKPSMVPWVIVAAMAIVFAAFGLRSLRDGGSTPRPIVDETVARAVEASNKQYASGLAAVMDSLAAKVESKDITNDTQLQSNARAGTAAAREQAFLPIGELDNANVVGSYVGREAVVAAYLRSKAEGHRRAAK